MQNLFGRNVMPGIKAAIVATLASCFLLGFDPASVMVPTVDMHLECGAGHSAARIGSGLAVTLRLEAAAIQNIPLPESDLGQLARPLLSEATAKTSLQR
jgi:hypothetical protein